MVEKNGGQVSSETRSARPPPFSQTLPSPFQGEGAAVKPRVRVLTWHQDNNFGRVCKRLGRFVKGLMYLVGGVDCMATNSMRQGSG